MDAKKHLYGFEKLEIWKNSRKFVNMIYEISKNFPYHESRGLASQIRRSAVSVMANIAEDTSRFSKKTLHIICRYTHSSLMEVLSHSYIAYDRHYIDEEKLEKIKMNVYMISNKINALHKSLVRR
ncbi:MAG: four helix bundle protein [Candidatus Marinimicrobia bacterium]|nr:four helix bundle protein [Candidatus Neomarinimicrobiota bacterium]